jgi:hypothetical protein
MPRAAGHATGTDQLPAAARFIPQLLLTCNSFLDLQQFEVNAIGLSRYLTHLSAQNGTPAYQLLRNGLPHVVFSGLAHSLQLLAAAAPTIRPSSPAAESQLATLNVVLNLACCAKYCLTPTPAPAAPESAAVMSALTNGGETLLCIAS